MTLTEPTFTPPMAPSTVDMTQIFAAHAERTARIEALRPGNKDRLFDGLTSTPSPKPGAASGESASGSFDLYKKVI